MLKNEELKEGRRRSRRIKYQALKLEFADKCVKVLVDSKSANTEIT